MKRHLNKASIIFLAIAIYNFIGCKDDVNPIIPPPDPDYKITLTVDEIDFFSVRITVALNDTIPSNSIEIRRDGNPVLNFSINGKDTIVSDIELNSNSTYNYTAYLSVGGKIADTSGILIVTTLADLFPLIPGRVIVYGEGNLLYADTETPIPGTEVGFESKWIVTGQTSLIPHPALPVTLILDSTKVPATGADSQRSFFLAKDSASGNIDLLTNIGFFFRTVKIYSTPGDSASGIRADSLKWIPLIKPGKDLNNEWIAFSEEYFSSVYNINIRLEISAVFSGKEIITIAGSQYETYVFNAYRKIYFNNQLLSSGIMSRLWLVHGIGPVKMIFIGDAESHGKTQTMTSKNF